MTKNQQYISGMQVGSQLSQNKKLSISAALSYIKSRERNRERRIKNLGFLRVLHSLPVCVTGNVTEKLSPQNWLKTLASKALEIFALLPLPDLRSLDKSLIFLDSYVPEIPIYYIYRWVFVDTPYKYNLGFALVVSPIVGGAR